MPKALTSEDLQLLKGLADSYPALLHVHELGQRFGNGMQRADLLQRVDDLLRRGLIEGRPLRGSAGLENAANLRITGAGEAALDGVFQEAAVNRTLQPVQASVLNVLIASPSDVLLERDAVESAIHEWNGSHFPQTGLLLRPVRWEKSSFPQAGGRPQGLLNQQIVQDAHVLIGIFGSRLGTSTGVAESGTLEEIEQFLDTGRHVALYFSNAPVAREADRGQLEALEAYQRKRRKDSLYATFGSVEDLRRQVTAHLPRIVAVVQQTAQVGAPAQARSAVPAVAKKSGRKRPSTKRSMSIEDIGELSAKEIELLWNAAKDPEGEVFYTETFDGEDLRSNDTHFLEGVNRRTAAEWLTALKGLESHGLLEARSEERDLFQVTGEGYAVADELQDFAHWTTEAITLRAYYMNADRQEVTVQCRRVVALPATYLADQVSADGLITRNEKERRSILVEGVGSQPELSWEPTDVEFTDSRTGQVTAFRVDGVRYLRSGTLKIPITG